jgi:hypothetical protein
VATLIRKEEPFEFAVCHHFVESHKLVGHKGEIRRVLIAPTIYGFFGRQVVPLLACHLTTLAGSTYCCIDEE